MKYKTCKRYNIPNQSHELTFSCFQHRPFLAEPAYADRVIRAIDAAKLRHKFHLWAYVIMPDHVHLLVNPLLQEYSISMLLKSLKQPVSQSIVWAICHGGNSEILSQMETGEKARPYRFWQAGGGYDSNLGSVEAIVNSIDYIYITTRLEKA